MSFQQGLSGLNATSKNLEVIGNNVANSNTYGAKASRAEFADVYATAMNGAGGNNIGIGVNLASVSQQFTQGGIVTTDNPLDLAINGAGFFQLTDTDGSVTYSRNGQFKVDRDGYIINNQQKRLMGYIADATGTIQTGAPEALVLPTAGSAPNPTTGLQMELNLDAGAPTRTPPALPAQQIDFSDPDTYNNATSITTYDALGQEVALTYYFQKASTGVWNVYATANGSQNPLGVGSTAALPLPVTTITFSATGDSPTLTAGSVPFDIPATSVNGVDTLAIDDVDLDIAGSTQYGSPFAVTDLSQDGYRRGELVGIQMESNGIVTARFSNGQTRAAGQIEIATFRNPQGLQPLGGNQWASTFASGDPIPGAPGSGNLGPLQSGALEESNVDLTAELVSMMTAQRAYQANAQTIKTQDQVLQTLVNLR
jgi:flagellar hook protein FlgE